MKRRPRSPLGLYMIGIAGLFLAGFFLLVLFGAKIYRNTVAGQNANYGTRSLMSYLSTCVKANDASGGVYAARSDYGDVLVVTDGGSGYALRVYQAAGRLVEDFAAVDAPLSPESAQVIGETETFSVTYASDDLLSVVTDAGRVLIHIRSEGGGGE